MVVINGPRSSANDIQAGNLLNITASVKISYMWLQRHMLRRAICAKHAQGHGHHTQVRTYLSSRRRRIGPLGPTPQLGKSGDQHRHEVPKETELPDDVRSLARPL